MNFVAIDFETANSKRTSACSIGLAIVEDFAVTETKHWLIKPEPYYFDHFNTMLHGISENHVADAPTFDQLWPTLKPYIEDRIVVAHNASFDVSVMRHMFEYYSIPTPNIEILCSYRIAKAAYPAMGSHRLNVVCQALDIPLDHHRADSDAAASAMIICDIFNKQGITDINEIKEKFSLLPGYWYDDNRYKACRGKPNPKTDTLINHDAEYIDNDFAGVNFVFTGTLLSMTRSKAFEVVSKGGGEAQKGINKETDYLVVGIQDMQKLNGKKTSSKMRKAEDMQKDGHKIQIIGEDEFMNMIDDDLYKICFHE